MEVNPMEICSVPPHVVMEFPLPPFPVPDLHWNPALAAPEPSPTKHVRNHNASWSIPGKIVRRRRLPQSGQRWGWSAPNHSGAGRLERSDCPR